MRRRLGEDLGSVKIHGFSAICARSDSRNCFLNDFSDFRFVHSEFELLAELLKNQLGYHCDGIRICLAAAALAAASVAAGLALLCVGAEVCGVLTLHTELTADLVKSLNLSVCQLLRTAENLGLIKELSIELKGLHLVICAQK